MFRKFRGGVHPPGRKRQTENFNSEYFFDFEYVFIPLRQHIGEQVSSCVKEGEYVKVGQVIGKSKTAPWIHSSVSGNVEKIEMRLNRLGTKNEGILIRNDKRFKHINYHERKNISDLTENQFLKIIQEAGICGMGGAMFPTHRKLTIPENSKIEYLVVNGIECEPYLNADNRLMLEDSALILKGIKIVKELFNIPKILIGIEDNKIEAISEMRKRTEFEETIKIVKLQTKYPQGGEKQLLQSLFGKEMPGLPLDYGIIVLNVASCAAIYEAVQYGKPLVERIVTVAGGAIGSPKNLRIKLGTQLKDILDYCEVDRRELHKLILGGPMMGFAISDEKEAVIKGTNGILALSEKEVKTYKSRECISCGKCLDVCPMGLTPLKYVELLKNNKIEEMEKYDLKKCIRCSSCQYVCPVNQPMMEAIWYGFSASR